MGRERYKFPVFASVILRKGDKVLLMRRCKTGFDDGLYHCAGGGVDGCEPITQAIIREADEELGIRLKRDRLKIVHVLHFIGPCNEYEYINVFAQADAWEGEPKIVEPHKCDHLDWFAVDALPETIMPSVKHVIECVNKGVFTANLAGAKCNLARELRPAIPSSTASSF